MIVSPRVYLLFPGPVITGGELDAISSSSSSAAAAASSSSSSSSVTVIVNVAVTAAFTPSSALIVTVYAWAAALVDTVPCTWPFDADNPDSRPGTVNRRPPARSPVIPDPAFA